MIGLESLIWHRNYFLKLKKISLCYLRKIGLTSNRTQQINPDELKIECESKKRNKRKENKTKPSKAIRKKKKDKRIIS